METAAESHGNRMIRLALVLTCLTMLSLWRLSGLSARFVTGANSGDEARVAKFEVAGDITDGSTQNIVVYPGNTGKDASFTVQVTNSSEVAVRYKFTLENEGNLPLKLTTQPPDSKQTAEDSRVKKLDDAGLVWQTTDVIPPGDSVNSYTFYATWDEKQNDYRYSVGVQNVKIIVTAEQED
jgi:hypothetical protein